MAEAGSVDPSGNPEHEHLLYELETSDTSSVGLVLRAIYDGDEHQKFMERLDARIKNHDRDIEKMCNFHYQGFIESIRELLQVRTQVERLKSEIEEVDKELQKSASTLLIRGTELVRFRTVQSNIASAIESLSVCLPMLEMYSKMKKQMKEKRYYPALKTLEQLEHTYLPRVANYCFSQEMRDNIPCLRENIKDASISDLKDFLENIRKYSPKIGEVAMQQTAEQNNIACEMLTKKKKRHAPPPPNPFTGEVEIVENQYDAEQELSAQDLVDFSPVYRCLHIYSVLDTRESFETYYRTHRRQQAKLALQPPSNMRETIEGYQNYFKGIVGFFVVEDHIMNTTNGLVNRVYLDEVWDTALFQIVESLRTHSAYCTDAEILLKIKNLIIIFSYALRAYGYPVSRLFDLQLEICDQYNEILMNKWVQKFRCIFKEDNYHPIQVENLAEYNAVLQKFPYKDEELEKAPFPKRFPFSSLVPKVYNGVQEYVYACLEYSKDLNLSQTEADDIVRKSTNLLLTRTLGGCLSMLIKNSNLSLLQLIQITINTNYLEEASIYLEEFISNITGTSHDRSHVARLQGQSMFKDVRAEAEEQIYQQMKLKIDAFLDLANYDWLITEARSNASSYLVDLIAFLQSTFLSFTNLPAKVAQTSCMVACMHISKRLLSFLLDEETKQISMGAIQQFNLDVNQCEQFAKSEPVKGMEDGSLLMYFSDLRQILNLFLTWDWSVYFHDYGQENSKYLRVNPQTAIILLEKLREADKKNVFAVLKKSERDKKKLTETVLKQLKQLTLNGTT